MLKDDGLPAHRLEGAHRGVHASWQQRLSLLEDLHQQARPVSNSLVPKPTVNGIHQGVARLWQLRLSLLEDLQEDGKRVRSSLIPNPILGMR